MRHRVTGMSPHVGVGQGTAPACGRQELCPWGSISNPPSGLKVSLEQRAKHHADTCRGKIPSL